MKIVHQVLLNHVNSIKSFCFILKKKMKFSLVIQDSSIESTSKQSTPKHELYKVKY